jgi:hypothetical protein
VSQIIYWELFQIRFLRSGVRAYSVRENAYNPMFQLGRKDISYQILQSIKTNSLVSIVLCILLALMSIIRVKNCSILFLVKLRLSNN